MTLSVISNQKQEGGEKELIVINAIRGKCSEDLLDTCILLKGEIEQMGIELDENS